MKKQKKPQITITEALPIAVGKWISQNGGNIRPSNSGGFGHGSEELSSADGNFWLLDKLERWERAEIALVRLTGKEWIIFVNGRENISVLKNLAERLSRVFRVKINLYLENEKVQERSASADTGN